MHKLEFVSFLIFDSKKFRFQAKLFLPLSSFQSKQDDISGKLKRKTNRNAYLGTSLNRVFPIQVDSVQVVLSEDVNNVCDEDSVACSIANNWGVVLRVIPVEIESAIEKMAYMENGKKNCLSDKIDKKKAKNDVLAKKTK